MVARSVVIAQSQASLAGIKENLDALGVKLAERDDEGNAVGQGIDNLRYAHQDVAASHAQTLEIVRALSDVVRDLSAKLEHSGPDPFAAQPEPEPKAEPKPRKKSTKAK